MVLVGSSSSNLPTVPDNCPETAVYQALAAQRLANILVSRLIGHVVLRRFHLMSSFRVWS